MAFPADGTQLISQAGQHLFNGPINRLSMTVARWNYAQAYQCGFPPP